MKLASGVPIARVFDCIVEVDRCVGTCNVGGLPPLLQLNNNNFSSPPFLFAPRFTFVIAIILL